MQGSLHFMQRGVKGVHTLARACMSNISPLPVRTRGPSKGAPWTATAQPDNREEDEPREETKPAEEYDKDIALASVPGRVSSLPPGARPAACSGEDAESQLPHSAEV